MFKQNVINFIATLVLTYIEELYFFNKKFSDNKLVEQSCLVTIRRSYYLI